MATHGGEIILAPFIRILNSLWHTGGLYSLSSNLYLDFSTCFLAPPAAKTPLMTGRVINMSVQTGMQANINLGTNTVSARSADAVKLSPTCDWPLHPTESFTLADPNAAVWLLATPCKATTSALHLTITPRRA